tara:strand:+ start:441 stop:1115 length:675 start_codon:yes stop_codon:yes gene_type:complete
MVKVKKSDFIEINYIGKFSNGAVFDTNIKETGEKNKLDKKDYQPLTVCIGENQVIKGLDKNLDGSELEKDYTFEIPAEEAYGKKNPKLIRVVSKNLFIKQKMNPVPGMQINAEGSMGIIRSVSGGRVFVDFNHPLAGKDLVFDVRITKLLKDPKEKAQSLLQSLLMLDPSKYSMEIEGDKLKIKSEFDIPDMMLNVAKDKILKLVPEINSIEFSKSKKEATTSE